MKLPGITPPTTESTHKKLYSGMIVVRFHRRESGLDGKRFDVGAPGQRQHANMHFAKLATATALFLVAIGTFGRLRDGFAIRDSRVVRLDFDFVPAGKPFTQNCKCNSLVPVITISLVCGSRESVNVGSSSVSLRVSILVMTIMRAIPAFSASAIARRVLSWIPSCALMQTTAQSTAAIAPIMPAMKSE